MLTIDLHLKYKAAKIVPTLKTVLTPILAFRDWPSLPSETTGWSSWSTKQQKNSEFSMKEFRSRPILYLDVQRLSQSVKVFANASIGNSLHSFEITILSSLGLMNNDQTCIKRLENQLY